MKSQMGKGMMLLETGGKTILVKVEKNVTELCLCSSILWMDEIG
jgi:hypothetical protein